MAVVKYIWAVACFTIALTACSNEYESQDSDPSALCQALATATQGSRVPIKRFFVFGDLKHGVAGVDARCPVDAIRVRISKGSQDEGHGRNLHDLRYAVFFAPKVRSGMFAVSGEAIIDSKSNVVEIVKVDEFYEVSSSEKDRIFGLLALRQD